MLGAGPIFADGETIGPDRATRWGTDQFLAGEDRAGCGTDAGEVAENSAGDCQAFPPTGVTRWFFKLGLS